MGKVPLQVVKELEHQTRLNLCMLNFLATFTKAGSDCNALTEKCQDSIRATVKRIKS